MSGRIEGRQVARMATEASTKLQIRAVEIVSSKSRYPSGAPKGKEMTARHVSCSFFLKRERRRETQREREKEGKEKEEKKDSRSDRNQTHHR